MIDHQVQQGDCLLTIAEQYGFLWETVWNHSANAQLKNERKDPNVLRPGDVVRVPAIRLREYGRSTEARHRFRKKSNRAKVRVQVLDYEHRPRKAVSYVAMLDGEIHRGSTDVNGYLEILAPPNAQKLRLEVTQDGETDLYEFQLGHVDPIETMNGVRQRLINLGYRCAPGDAPVDEELQGALKEFQRRTNMTENGGLDGATRAKIKSLHGC